MIQIIEDEWLRLSIRFIEGEWFKLLKMNDSDYWRWMILIIEDEWFKLLEMNDEDYWRWMMKIIGDELFGLSIKFIEDEWLRFIVRLPLTPLIHKILFLKQQKQYRWINWVFTRSLINYRSLNSVPLSLLEQCSAIAPWSLFRYRSLNNVPRQNNLLFKLLEQ